MAIGKRDIELLSVGDGIRRMGPLAYADQIGLDVILKQLQDLEREHGLRFRPASILRQKVGAGELGHASGYGFGRYVI